MNIRLFLSITLFSVVMLALAALPAHAKGSGSNNSSSTEDIYRKLADTTVSPGKDFFTYATGAWMKQNPIPESESNWGIGKLVQEETYARLRSISEAAASDKSAAPGSALQKIGDMWATGMD